MRCPVFMLVNAAEVRKSLFYILGGPFDGFRKTLGLVGNIFGI